MLNVAARGPSENARRITQDGLDVIGIQPESQIMVGHVLYISPYLQGGADFLRVPSVLQSARKCFLYTQGCCPHPRYNMLEAP